MSDKDLRERTKEFALKIIRLVASLPRTREADIIGRQLLKAGTSVGANYEEACGAESRADFIHKLKIVLKEIREAKYWLKLIQKANLMKDENIKDLIQETKALTNIIAKSIITAKSKQR